MTHLLTPLLRERSDLNWSVADPAQIDDSAAFEAILNYGDWQDVTSSISKLGLPKAHRLFITLANQPRSNLRPEIKHYFSLFFDYHDKPKA